IRAPLVTGVQTCALPICTRAGVPCAGGQGGTLVVHLGLPNLDATCGLGTGSTTSRGLPGPLAAPLLCLPNLSCVMPGVRTRARRSEERRVARGWRAGGGQ